MNVLLQMVHILDRGVYGFLNGFAGNWFVDHVASFEESDNLLKGGLFLAMYAALWFRVGPDQEHWRRTILAILTGTLLALVVSRTIADIFPFRLRPMFDLTLPHHAYSLSISRNMMDWSSFPSDTSAYFVALAFGLVQLLPRYSVTILLYTASWICLPRMFLGEHYLSDIVVGAAIGMAAVKASLASEWLQRSIVSPVLHFVETKPQVFYGAAFLIFFEMGVMFDDVRFVARGLFQALHTVSSRELLRATPTAFGILGVVLMAVALLFLPLATSTVPLRSFRRERFLLLSFLSRMRP